jgi:EthD domain
MPYTILLLAYRKPGVSPTEFKSHYESSHVPILQSIAGSLFPTSHTRRYIHRVQGSADGGADNTSHPATVLIGEQADFEYDAIVELVFDNEAAFHAFSARISESEAAERIARDENLFLDRAKMKAVVVGDCNVTTRPTTSG